MSESVNKLRRIKILFFSKEAVGGPNTLFEQVEKKLNKKYGTKFYIYFIRASGLKLSRQFNYIESSNLSDFSNFSLHKLFIFVNHLFRTYKIISLEKPSLIVTVNIYAALINYMVKVVFFRKTILVCLINNNLHEIALRKGSALYSLLFSLLTRFVLNHTDRNIFVSGDLAKFLNKTLMIKNKYSVIYNGVDSQKISKLSKKPIPNYYNKLLIRKSTKIFTIARLEKQKDILTILEAFKLLRDQYSNIDLYIIGEGSQKAELINQVKNLSLTKNVHFLGWQNNIYPFLKQSDILIHSSFFEGFGRTIVEAMVLGKPVISTNSPFGPAEILGYGRFGILIPVNNPKELVESVGKLIKNRQLMKKYSRLSLERVKEFELSDCLRKYEDLFANLLSLPVT